MYTPKYDQYKHTLEEGHIVPPAEMDNNMVIPSSLHEKNLRNCDGPPGSMKNVGIMWMMKRLHTFIGGHVYYEYVVSDNDSSMRNRLTRPETRPTGKKDVAGYLTTDVYISKLFTDPSHRIKSVAW